MINIKKFWPFIVLFFIFLIYSYPYLFGGKVPFPTSYIANNIAPWNSYSERGPIKNGIPDVPGEIFPMRSLVIDFWKQGNVPLWNPYILSGTPLLANFQSAVFFPFNVLFFVIPKVDAWSILILLQPILAGIFTFLLCKKLKLSDTASFFASISFMFCGYLTVWGSYMTMGYTVLFLPLILYLSESYFENKNKIFLPIITLTLAFSFFSGHIQSFMYVFVGTFIYGFTRLYCHCEATKWLWQSKLGLLHFVRNDNYKIFTIWIIFILLVIPLVAIQLLPTLEFYQYTSRSLLKNNPENVGIPINYLVTLLAPDFFGNPVTRNDWFGTYAEWSGYAGLIPLIFAFLIKIDKRSMPFLAIAIAGFIFSVKTPVLSFITMLPVPILQNSNPSRAIVLLSFSVAILSGFGFEQLINNWQKVKSRLFIILISISVIFLLLFTVTFFGTGNLKTVSFKNLILPALILFSAWFIYMFLQFRFKWKRYLIACFLFLVVFEMLRFYLKWTPFDSRNLFYSKTYVGDFLKTQKSASRFYGQFGQADAYMDHLYTVDGYEPLNLLSYAQLINAAGDGKTYRDYFLNVHLQSREKYTKTLLNLLGVRYLIYSSNDLNNPFELPFSNTYSLKFDDGKYKIFENPEYYKRARLVGNYKVVAEKQDVVSEMLNKTDLKKTVVLTENPGISDLGEGEVKIVNYGPNKVEITTSSSKSSILLLSDNYFPGWKVNINNKPGKILQADYTLRAVAVPAGINNVVFRYEPDSFKYGIIISGTTLIFIILFLIMSLRAKSDLAWQSH